MRRASLVMFTCIVQTLVPLSAKSQGLEPQPYEEKEAYVVYSAILRSKWSPIPKDSKRILIINRTYPFTMCLKPDEETRAVVGQAFDNYSDVNKKRWVLKQKFHVETPYDLISTDNAINKWRTDPRPITFSAIGFNKKKTIAVTGVMYGSNGGFLTLMKKDGKWQLLDKYHGGGCAWAA